MIGIDLGTTNSLVAVMENGHARALANELDEVLTPSAVAVAEDGELLVGRAARDRLVTEPGSGQACFKRDMGMAKTYRFGGRNWSPVECSAVVLKEMRRIAENHIEGEADRAVITVPAYFHDQQRQATLEAAEIAGIQVERLVNEPTSAALAYGYRASDQEEQLLVFDIGGGTFDVTLLEIFEDIIEVKASGGVSRLGGEDYTDKLADWILKREGVELRDSKLARWRQQIEVAKRRLARQPETVVSLDGKEIGISRTDLEKSGADLTARIRPVLKRCLRDAGVEKENIDDILLVGGASRMPVIAQLVAEELGRLPNQSLDADQVVALGAAVQSALVRGDESVDDIVLTDVCPHTLGVETSRELGPNRVENGFFAPLIDRNTVIPVSRSDIFHTLQPQQNEVLLKVYQGEGRKVFDNKKIGEIRVPGLRHRPGQKRPGEVDVRFSYDMNGILEVEATVLHNNKKYSRVFEQRPGTLSKKEIKEAIARLAPLKIHPRDKLPNRARLERGQRLFEDLKGPARERLSALLDGFEAALEMQEDEPIQISAALLDSFMDPFFEEEGENQPQ